MRMIMRFKSIKYLLTALLALGAATASAGGFDWSAGVGYNIGATTPLGLPASIRSIGGYSPGANISAGVNATYMLAHGFGIGLGVSADNLNMNAEITTRNYHLTMDIVDGDETGTRTGYYTGKIHNKTRLTYLTVPLYAVYRPDSKWEVDLGPYVAFALHRSFKGEVSEGRMREDPYHPVISITKAEYDYSSDLRNVDAGIMAAASRKVWRGLAVKASMRWGLMSVMNPSTRKIDINTYNVYLNIGASYSF